MNAHSFRHANDANADRRALLDNDDASDGFALKRLFTIIKTVQDTYLRTTFVLLL
jgi:hypothetical protein